MTKVQNRALQDSFPCYTAAGTPHELGQQHGVQARTHIHGFLDYLGHMLKLSREQLHCRAVRFLPLFGQFAPHLVEEICGLAEGASIPMAEALAVQIRGELAQIQDEGCTAFVVAPRGCASGQILIGQNSDVEPEMDEFAYVLRLVPEDRPAMLMWTFGGMIGYHGLNSAGIAHFANSLGGGPKWKFGLPHYPVKRLMLEQRSLDDVLGVLQHAPVCSSGNYVLCDGIGRIADVELTPAGFALLDDAGENFIAHSNHFVCSPFACRESDAASVPDSVGRLSRLRQLLTSRVGKLTVEDLKTFLADHEGAPTSICRHAHEGPDHPLVSRRGRTVASLIAEPAAGRLHISRGNPCCARYTTYELA